MARLLVVDDSSFQRLALKDLLQEAGHEVLLAENGAVGLARLRGDAPDAVLLDLDMPVLDGFGFLAQRAELELATPTAVVSGDAQDEVRERCLALGAAEFLQKPVSAEALVAAVERLLPDLGDAA